MEKRIYQIALSLLNGVGPIKTKELLRLAGDLEHIFSTSKKQLAKQIGVGVGFVERLEREKALKKAESELEFIEKHNIQLHYFEDPSYPAKLKVLDDGPLVIFTKGKVSFNQKKVAVVGTRKATPYGKKMCSQLIEDLAPLGVQVISGLAHGIDKRAHEAALENSLSTVAVLGHGLDSMYPAAHRGLARQMLETGGLITEFVSGVPGDPKHFPRRNRIVAGLCEAVVIVESSEKGGSMITANLANDYNRDVFAFPGDVNREHSKGCNNLIRRNRAHLITCAEDMVDILGWEMREKEAAVQQDIFDQMTGDEERLLRIFQEKGNVDIDSLSYRSKMKTSDLSVHLFNMELKGIIQSMPGKVYGLA